MGFVKNNINIKRSKSWDMRFYWLREKQIKKIFNIFWEEAATNKGEYYTKTSHSVLHHRSERPKHVRDVINIIMGVRSELARVCRYR